MDYLSVFIEMLQAKNLAPNTIRGYQTYLKPYLSYLLERNISPEHASWEMVRENASDFPASFRPHDEYGHFSSPVLLDLCPASAMGSFPDPFPQVPYLSALCPGQEPGCSLSKFP